MGHHADRGDTARRILADYARSPDREILSAGGAELEALAAMTETLGDRLNFEIDRAVVLSMLADADADERLFDQSRTWFARVALDDGADDRTRIRSWSNWARAELAAARRFGRPELVGSALSHVTSALARLPDQGDARYWALSAAGSVHQHRFQLTGDPADLNAGVLHLREALLVLADDDPDLPEALRSLAVALSTRFQSAGEDGRAEHAEAVQLLRRARGLTSEDTLTHWTITAVLGGLLVEGASLDGQSSLNEAMSLLTMAYERSRGPERDLIADDLAASLLVVFRRTGDHSLLDHAVEILSVYEDTSPPPPRQATRAARLGAVLTVRHQSFGDSGDLTRALLLLEQAQDLDALAGEDDIQLRSDLGAALLHRFDWSGQVADLDRALDVLHEAVTRMPTRASQVGHRVLSNMSTAHLTHHEALGDLASLKAGITLLDELTAGTSPASERAGWLASLGVAYQARFNAMADPADITLAMDALRESTALFQIELGPDLPTHEARTALSNLAEAEALLAQTLPVADPRRFQLLNESVRSMRAAASAARMTDQERALRQTNLGSLLMQLHDEEPSEPVRAEAFAALQAAVDLTPSDQPRRVIYLSNLASFLFSIGEQPDDRSRDIARAIELLASAATSRSGVVLQRIWAASTWAQLASNSGDLDGALTAYRTAIELIPDLAGRRLSRADRQFHLAALAELARDAAACALQRRRPQDAQLGLELLEQGRGVLLQQALQGRHLGGLLARLLPGLAQLLTTIDDELGQLDHLADRASPADSVGDPSADGLRRRILAEQRERTLEEIRGSGIPALADYGRPSSVHEIAAGLGQDTAIVINISQYRSDVFVVTPIGVKVIACPALTPSAIHERIDQLDRSITTLESLPGDADDQLIGAAESVVRSQFHQTARWLWDEMAERALDLAELVSPMIDPLRAPRVWWVPTGELARFPVHSAGHHDDPGSARTVVSRVVSSYATSCTALHESRRLLDAGTGYEHPPPQDGEPAAVIVAMPSTPALGPGADLAGAADELDIVREHFPQAVSLVGEGAYRKDVVAGIRRASILHLACTQRVISAIPIKAACTCRMATSPSVICSVFHRGRGVWSTCPPARPRRSRETCPTRPSIWPLRSNSWDSGM